MYYVFRWYYRYHHHHHHYARYYPRSTPLPLLHMANATAITTITTTTGTAALGAPTSVTCSTTNQVPAPASPWRAEHRVPGVLTREASDVPDMTTTLLTDALLSPNALTLRAPTRCPVAYRDYSVGSWSELYAGNVEQFRRTDRRMPNPLACLRTSKLDDTRFDLGLLIFSVKS